MKTYIIMLVLTVCCFLQLQAQSLYMPSNVKAAFEKGTRAMNGKQDMHETPVVWKKDEKQAIVNIKSKKKIHSLTIDHGIWMDANEKDNGWPLRM